MKWIFRNEQDKIKKKKKELFDFEKAIRGKRLPILTLDERWLTLFAEQDMPPSVKHLRDELNDLLKKQGRITEDIKGMKRYKTQLMQEIVDNMEVNETPLGQIKAKKLEKNQKILIDMKEKLEKTEDELSDIPYDIQTANERLMAESSRICYGCIKYNQERVAELDHEITDLREQLKARILEKQDREIENSSIYSYMHSTYGPEIMELLDICEQKKPNE